ncbi:hypothetical protein [Gracilimonas sediminicola]|uniref:MORN repeat variant n=1 Tax=Gracilimonas sediminicola TaxID=2952158 RepID=A0A9X2RDN3_9BACT|nr:hypothetical protein [Gracilimonas sediminicola]MCP9291370.1 hypothetical protein [Gracilimonas sediminicola]
MRELIIFAVSVILLSASCMQNTGKYHPYSLTDEVTLLAEYTNKHNIGSQTISVRGYNFPYRLFDPDSKEPYTGTHSKKYENGETGKWTIENGYMVRIESFYADGQPAFLARFDKNEEIESRAWFKDGTLKMTFKEGFGDVFNQNGDVIASYEHFAETKYFKNGNIKTVIPLNDDNLYHGTVLIYNEDGSKRGEIEYNEGLLISQKEL